MKLDNLRIPKALDKRRKLTDENKEEIKRLYKQGMSIHSIAREFENKCCKRNIQFILFPNRAEQVARQHDWAKYYSKEKHKIAMQKHRQHKRNNIDNLLTKTEEPKRKHYEH